MPKLPADLIEPTEEAAQSTNYKAMDDGVYTVRLAKVTAEPSRDGKPMWRFEWDQIRDMDGGRKGGRLFSNVTIEESVAWKIAQFFGAFDVPNTVDTDELMGSRIRVQVIKRVQDYAGSKNYGQEINEIDRYLPLIAGDDGYEQAVALKAKLSGPKKATPAKAAAKAAAPAAPKVAPVDGADDADEVVDPDEELDF